MNQITPDLIISTISDYFSTPFTAWPMPARQCAMTLLSDLTHLTNVQISKLFSLRDATSIPYHIRRACRIHHFLLGELRAKLLSEFEMRELTLHQRVKTCFGTIIVHLNFNKLGQITKTGIAIPSRHMGTPVGVALDSIREALNDLIDSCPTHTNPLVPTLELIASWGDANAPPRNIADAFEAAQKALAKYAKAS